jgi:hypothetical protein
MTTIIGNVDLNSANQPNSPFDGWETCAAVGGAGDVVVYTGNWFAAYSANGGTTFTWMDPNIICRPWGKQFCCDQVVAYIPQINNFAWVLLTNDSTSIIVAIATPDDIRMSGGTNWVTYLFSADMFTNQQGDQLDYPQIAAAESYLHVTFDIPTKGYSGALRLDLNDLRNHQPVRNAFFLTTSLPTAPAQNYNLAPVQNPYLGGGVGIGRPGAYFVVKNSESNLRVFYWQDGLSPAPPAFYYDVPIATTPSEDWTVKTPDNDDWLGSTSKISSRIMGATLTGNQLWIAWTGARKVAGQQSNTFNYPQIDIAIIGDTNSRSLIGQRFIWNPDFGFAWPSLATNSNGDVGVSFCWGGGNRWYPQHAVMMLTGPGATSFFEPTTSGVTNGAGGHYVSNRQAYPLLDTFCASGFNQIKTNRPNPDRVNHPHYILFKT